MMKQFSILLFVLAFTNCKMFKMIGEEKLTAVSDEMQLEELDGKIAANFYIKDSTYKFMFDTGSSSTIILDTTILQDYNAFKKVKFGTVKLANNKKVRLNNIALTSKNMLYSSLNEVVSVLIPKANPCNKSTTEGIMGVNYFMDGDNKIINLDFEALKIKVFSEDQKQHVLSDYKEVKSKFFSFRRHIKVFIEINGIEEPFLFDTGNTAIPFLISEKSKLKFNDGIEYRGSILKGADNETSNNKNIYYNNTNVAIGKNNLKSVVLFSNYYKSKYNNVGLSFIKNFNWILDYKNKKVYYKQIKADFIKEVNPFQYKAYNTSDTLSVSVKLSSATAYNLGDQITSVNNVSVTPENICEFQSLLNKTEDWNTLKLEVIPVKTKK